MIIVKYKKQIAEASRDGTKKYTRIITDKVHPTLIFIQVTQFS